MKIIWKFSEILFVDENEEQSEAEAEALESIAAVKMMETAADGRYSLPFDGLYVIDLGLCLPL